MIRKFTLTTLLFFSCLAVLNAQVKRAVNPRELMQLNNAAAGSAQSPLNITEKCGFELTMQQAAGRGFNSALYEQEMQRLITERRLMNNFGPPTTIYTIPVIFHIIYDGNTESAIGTGANISTALVNAQIAQLNTDFADMAGSTYGVAEDMGVRFVAAKVDPSGNIICTPGIERINWRSRAGWSDPRTLASNAAVQNHYNNIVKPQSIWDPNNYINIWLANFETSGLLGYASFPGQSTLPGLDEAETDQTAGVVVLSGSVGSVTVPGSAAPYDYGRTLTHELGHFFGLRHINGDANCGDDFCGDTPTQSALTGGCPAPGTANGCTPSVPKMFENYMDYSNDACLNTFTLNQSERCQTVMLNSPRRQQLRFSTRGNAPIPNRVSFKAGPAVVSEIATGGCPRFRDYNVVVGVDVAASGNATVSLGKSGTATDNADYTIIQSSVNYTNGDAADKTFTLRVFDDAATEAAETIVLSLNITGTGVQISPACAAVNQMTITIADDDAIVSINNSTPNPILYTQDFGTTAGSNQLPAGWTFVNGTSSTTNKWVGNNTGAATYGFVGNTLHISNGNATAVTNGTAAMTYSSVTAGTDARAVTQIINAQGLKNITVSFKLVCNGELDAGEFYDYGIAYYTLDGTNYSALADINGNFILQGITALSTVSFSLPPGVIGTSNFGLLFRWISDNTVANQPPFAIDDLSITGTAVSIESQVNNSSTENIPAGAEQSTFYSSTDGQIIARIQNSSANLGCVTANIAATGDGFTVLNTSSGSFARSNKVITINPSVANTTASYRATFYFTAAELAAWGVNTPNLKLMKVANGVNLSSTITAANAQIVTATFDDQLSTRGYAAYTGDFTGGFSQFMLVSPTATVPVAALSFEAKPNGKAIALSWNTSAEINNKGFVIERSTDGTHFETIGWKDGKGNSSITSHYNYIDNFVQPNQLYYYRLRQTDIDSRETLSDIRQAKISDRSALLVTMSPNPAKNQVKIFTAGATGLSNINIVDAKGSLVQSWKQVNCSVAPLNLDISKIAAGVYMVQVVNGDVITAQKLIIN